jgi:hypothetical protein
MERCRGDPRQKQGSADKGTISAPRLIACLRGMILRGDARLETEGVLTGRAIPSIGGERHVGRVRRGRFRRTSGAALRTERPAPQT